MANYDEDLHENHFFKALVETNNALYNKAADNKWLICVPRSDTVSRLKLGKSDFESHVFIPCGEDGVSYRSVNNKMVTIDSSNVITGEGYRDLRRVKILFEETFFNQRDENYRVLCLAQPLEGAISDEPVTVALESCDDCINFLWSDSTTHRTRKKIDGLLQQFSALEQEFEKTKKPRIAILVDVCRAFFVHAVQFAMRDSNIKRSIHGSVLLKNALYLSIETYIMSQLYPRVFKEVCVQRSGQDADLNKVTRKLSDVSPDLLGVKPPYQTNIVAVTDKLSSLNNYHTPLEKLVCIRNSISLLHDPSTNSAMTADELLSVFVYLIVTCDIPNWYGNIIFIKGFSLSQCISEDQLYLLTSLEAGLQYLTSKQVSAATPTEERTKTLEDSGQISFIIRTDSIQQANDEKSDVELFFEGIIKNDIAKVKALLNRVQDNVDFSDFCHPLCECDRCEAIKQQQQNVDEDDSDPVTVYSRGEHGRTGLHHAARKGHVDIIEILLEYGSSVMAPDNYGSTPLHLACQKGHQRATLLLLSNGADSNSIDHRGSTPLHLACSYGHTECVKALLFHTGGSAMCNVNIANDVGDTALHNAARWGFGTIVSLLLEHRANPLLTNKSNETPLQCAYNKHVRDILLPVINPDAHRLRKSLTLSHHKLHQVSHPHDHNPSDNDITRSSRTKSLSVHSHLKQQQAAPPLLSVHQPKVDRLVKKLLKAGTDGDLGMVKFLLHWNQPPKSGGSEVANDDAIGSKAKSMPCHPLCDCDNCIKMKININSCDSDGFTLLHQACLHGHHRLVELVIEHNADINVMTTDDRLTPLHYVCQYNHKDIVLLFLEHKVKLNPQDKHLNTPLHFCCNNGHMESATLLMIHGADVNVANDRGDTPLHNASRWNHPELVHELLLYGAKFMTVNNNGMTAFDLTKSEDCKRTLLDAREGVIKVGVHATKPGDIESLSSSNKFDSSPPLTSSQNHHDNTASSPNSELLGSWDLIEPSSSRKRGNSSTASGVTNIFKDIESYERSVSFEK